jgi:hypothetical protein
MPGGSQGMVAFVALKVALVGRVLTFLRFGQACGIGRDFCMEIAVFPWKMRIID